MEIRLIHDDGGAVARKLLAALDELRKINPHMEMGQAAALATIHARPGITLKELEAAVSLSKSAISRLVAQYGKKAEAAGGMIIVEVRDCHKDGRVKRVWPTKVGAEIIGKIERTLT